MKIGSNNSTHHSIKTAPEVPDQDASKKGAIIILDSFVSQGGHGYQVEGAAKELGDPGHIWRASPHQLVDGRVTLPHVQATKSLQEDFKSQDYSPQDAASRFAQFVEEAAVGNLARSSEVVEELASQGFENSVLNYSQGLDAIALMQLTKHALGGGSKLDNSQKLSYYRNLQAATGSASADSVETDKAILKTISGVLRNSDSVASAKQQWSDSVENFESNRNSVVVAAGNSGGAFKGLTHAGFELEGDEDHNLLAVDGVTTVSALTTNKQGSQVMEPLASFGPEVDFLASGIYGEQGGTSFAAPRVANTLRAAHLYNPEMSSEEVEAWTAEQIATPAEVLGTRLAILDTQRAKELLGITRRLEATDGSSPANPAQD